MKKFFSGIICAGILLAGAAIGSAQDRPEKVPNFATLQQPHEWYVTQERLWREETERTPQDENAWFNYFKAARYAGFGDAEHDPAEKAESMARLVEEMERAIPNTFTIHYVKWWNGGNNAELFPELEKAYAIRQDYTELSEDFITYYEMHGNLEKEKFFAQKWYQTKEMPTGLLEYNYNVLMSVEKNAILFTVGDNDTYPLLVLQQAKGIRPDVTVLNVSLMTDADYRAMIMKREKIQGDPSKLDYERFARTPYDTCVAEFLKSVAESNRQRPVYFALTCSPEYLALIKEDLYTVGLANRYSPKRLDNVAILKKNWERFRLDYLDLDFYAENYDFNKAGLPMLHMNYVTPALLLYEHYRTAGQREQAAQFREFALMIARQGGQAEEVERYIAGLDATEQAGDQEDADSEKTANATSEEADLGHDVKILPNPASDAITIAMPEAVEAEVQLVDMQGKVLRTMTSGDREIRMSTEGADAGTYVVHVRTAKGHFSKTVQIIR